VFSLFSRLLDLSSREIYHVKNNLKIPSEIEENAMKPDTYAAKNLKGERTMSR